MKLAEEKKFSYNSRRLRRKLRRGGQHCIHRGNRIFMQTVFLKYMFFLPILYFERKFFSCSLKALRRGCNHCIRRVQRNTMRKNKNLILRKTLNFYTILGDCEENIGVVVNTAYSETIGTSCRPFFWNICFFFKIFVLWAQIFRLSLKTFRPVCNHSIFRIYRNVLRKNEKGILRKKNNFYTILWDCEENFGVVVNTAYSETMGTLCRPFFRIICFFLNFCTLSAKFSDFR